MKVAHKLTAALVVGILVVHGISAAITITRHQQQRYDDIQRHERVLGRSMSRTISRVWHASGQAEALSLVDEANERHEREIRWIWLDAPPGDDYAAAASPDVVATVSHHGLVVAFEADAVYTYVKTEVPGDRIGAIEITERLDEEDAYLRSTLLFGMITAFALVLCCGVLAWALGRTLVTRPMGMLLKYAARVETGDLTQRLAPRSRDELGELSVALSKMCDGLERARDRVELETQSRLNTIEQLRHADRLATVGALAAGVAHELGTPINVIEGHAQLIREHPVAAEPITQNAAIITKQCKRMAAIIHDLLRFSRRVPPTGSTADVLEAARETIRMCEVLARKRGVTTVVEGTGQLVARIAPEPMQQILTNIVMNGIQAMPEGGSLSLRVSRQRATPPDRDEAGEYICTRVEDSGVGMDEATRQRVFEPFFTTKNVGEGTGLGLSVALGISTDHHGWIDVTSQRGHGSVVSIYIPSSPEESTE
jgi:two-component system NtrC family sensor kinase